MAKSMNDHVNELKDLVDAKNRRIGELTLAVRQALMFIDEIAPRVSLPIQVELRRVLNNQNKGA